jgi:hypothetical protein
VWRKRKSTHEMSACTEYGHGTSSGWHPRPAHTKICRRPQNPLGLPRTRERMGEPSSSSWPSWGAAAAAYDYERDPRWAEYRASSAVPPHLFTDPYVRAHLQHKFYRRFVVRTTTTTTPLQSSTPRHNSPVFLLHPVACEL